MRRVALGATGFVVMFGAAQLALWAGRVSPDTFPLPSAVLGSALDLARNGQFLASVGDTMIVWLEAMAVATVIAVPAGLLLGSVGWVRSALAPLIEFLRPFPAVALSTLVLLVVQDFTRTELVITAYAALWPVLINTLYGIRSTDPLAKETLRSFGFGPLSVVGRVSLPSAAPFAATGVRIAASAAFVVAVAVELISSGMNGIGAFAGLEESGGNGAAVLLAIAAWTGLLGVAINVVFSVLERRAFRWHFARTGAGGVAR